MRIEQHPVLGTYEKGPLVTFTLDGKEMTGYEGEPIAAALRAEMCIRDRDAVNQLTMCLEKSKVAANKGWKIEFFLSDVYKRQES